MKLVQFMEPAWNQALRSTLSIGHLFMLVLLSYPSNPFPAH